MRREGMTRLEAAHEWVREFDAIQRGIIEKLQRAEPEEWHEVTPPATGDRVYVYLDADKQGYGEIKGYDEESDLYAVETDDGHFLSLEDDDFEVVRDDDLPMWGTMWSFGDSADDYWLEEMGGLRIMADCGFRIFEHEEFGYFFGIDGAGYDFYEAHWLPLYNARGLQWHDANTDKKEED